MYMYTYVKRNCLLRLERSMVSMSITSIRVNPIRACSNVQTLHYTLHILLASNHTATASIWATTTQPVPVSGQQPHSHYQYLANNHTATASIWPTTTQPMPTSSDSEGNQDQVTVLVSSG